MLTLPLVESMGVEKNNIDFTHTIFAEYGTTTSCPYCPPASNDLFSIYQSGEYPFYFVSLVADENRVAGTRLYYLKAVGVPVVYFDGGEIDKVGEPSESIYGSIIQDMGTRLVKAELDMDVSVIWMGDAKIKINVMIKNNGSKIYIGILRSCVTEIISRWLDYDGDPYHFALLDYAQLRPIILLPGKTKSFSTEWDGKKSVEGQTFEDITEDNVMIISSVSHWLPQKRITDEYEKTFYALIVDQTAGAIP